MSEPVAPPSILSRWAYPTGYVVIVLALLILLLLVLPLERLDEVVKLIVGLSWPLVVLIAAWWFRPEIRDKLRNLRKIGKAGAEFEGPVQPQEKGDPAAPGLAPNDSPTPSASASATQPLRPEDTVSPIYQPLIALMAARLDERLPAAQQMSGRSAPELLRVWLCGSAAALHLERASRHVFKSQLDALDGLKAAPSVTVSDFKTYYDRTPAAEFNYPFEAWLGFLASFDLIVVSGEAVEITPAGRVLSHYMAERRYGRGVETN